MTKYVYIDHAGDVAIGDYPTAEDIAMIEDKQVRVLRIDGEVQEVVSAFQCDDLPQAEVENGESGPYHYVS